MPCPAHCKRSAAEARHQAGELRPGIECFLCGALNFDTDRFGSKATGGCMEQFAAVKRSKDGQPVQYLIVDDSVFARKNLGRIIESFGGQIAGEAGDGITAISEYDRLKPDIVLMDITMPQMEGIEAAEKIVQKNPEARVVMVSSVGYQENIVAALQRGARHFVQKPVKPEVLYEVIKYVLGEDGSVAAAAGAGA
jgi:two-component system chemotaxis response regulator CheY